MIDPNVPAQNEEEVLQRMQAAYDEFAARLEALRKERLELAKRVVSRIEKRKLEEVIESIKHSL
jgi:hypothetical protein